MYFKTVSAHIFISFLCTVYSEQDVNLYRSDYMFSKTVDGWLKLHHVPATWFEAERRCHHEGAILASPLNQQLLAVTKELSKEIQCGMFTGIHATFHKGDYISAEGTPLSRIPIEWAPNEPDNYNDSESCLMMFSNGTMADVKCDDIFPYICYKKRTPDMFISGCGTTDAEYKYHSRTGSCYKFHRIGRIWSDAFSVCLAEGGHLAIMNNEVEVEVMKDLFKEYPASVISGQFKDIFLIGIHDQNEHGYWRTIHGESLESAGYTKWSPGEPNNATGGQFCGAIFRNGLFDDIWCHSVAGFICEISLLD